MYLSKGDWHISGEERHTGVAVLHLFIHGFVLFVEVYAGKTELCWFGAYFPLRCFVLGRSLKIFPKNISRQFTGNTQTLTTPYPSHGQRGLVSHLF